MCEQRCARAPGAHSTLHAPDFMRLPLRTRRILLTPKGTKGSGPPLGSCLPAAPAERPLRDHLVNLTVQRPTAPLPVGLVEREFRSPLEWYILVCVGIGGGSDRVAALSLPHRRGRPMPKIDMSWGRPRHAGKIHYHLF